QEMQRWMNQRPSTCGESCKKRTLAPRERREGRAERGVRGVTLADRRPVREAADRFGRHRSGDRHGVVGTRDREAAQRGYEIGRLVLSGESHRSEGAADRVFEQLQRLRIVRQPEAAEFELISVVRCLECDSRQTLSSAYECLGWIV